MKRIGVLELAAVILGGVLVIMGLAWRLAAFDFEGRYDETLNILVALAGLPRLVAEHGWRFLRLEWMGLMQVLGVAICVLVGTLGNTSSLVQRRLLAIALVLLGYSGVLGLMLLLPAVVILASGSVDVATAEDMSVAFAGVGALWITAVVRYARRHAARSSAATH